MNSLVTIGVPVYNGAREIRQALDSLLAQSYRNLELHISDNASTDDTAEICRSYAAQDARVHYYRNPRNVGIMGNWRRVLQGATGEYFMWAAHDDHWSPNYVETLLECLRERPAAVLAAGRTLYINIDGSRRNMDPDDAPGRRENGKLGIAKHLLEQHAHNWLHGLFRTGRLLELSPVFFKGDPWGADVVFLLLLCLTEEIAGADGAVMYKRATGVSGPKTARQRVRWQCRFALELLQVIRGNTLAGNERREMLKAYVLYLRWLYFPRGIVPWARLWGKAAFHWSIGIDRP